MKLVSSQDLKLNNLTAEFILLNIMLLCVVFDDIKNQNMLSKLELKELQRRKTLRYKIILTGFMGNC